MTAHATCGPDTAVAKSPMASHEEPATFAGAGAVIVGASFRRRHLAPAVDACFEEAWVVATDNCDEVFLSVDVDVDVDMVDAGSAPEASAPEFLGETMCVPHEPSFHLHRHW